MMRHYRSTVNLFLDFHSWLIPCERNRTLRGPIRIKIFVKDKYIYFDIGLGSHICICVQPWMMMVVNGKSESRGDSSSHSSPPLQFWVECLTLGIWRDTCPHLWFQPVTQQPWPIDSNYDIRWLKRMMTDENWNKWMKMDEQPDTAIVISALLLPSQWFIYIFVRETSP